MKNRFFSALVLVLLVASTVSILVPPALAATQVEFTGSGWGHGVGMSQWGAFGMAQQGATSTDILTHYYSGTSIGSISSSTVSSWLVNEAKPLWVSIIQNRTSISFKPSGSGASLCFDSSSTPNCLSQSAQDGTDWRFRSIGSQCVFENKVGGTWATQGSSGSCSASVTPLGSSGGIQLSSTAITYRWGVLRLRPKSPSGATTLHGVWQIDIEEYVRGINEVPDSWPTAALRSQVIAARSYALARARWRGSESTFSTARKATCWCNLYSSTNDQVFKGWTAESQNTRFVAQANATVGTIVVSQGRVAEAVYSSSSGGSTERNSDYWGGAQLPYLQSVSDTAAQIPQNPNASWTASVSPATIASKLGLDSLTSGEVTQRFESGSVKEVRFTGLVDLEPTSIPVSGNWVRSNLGLRSRYFSINYGSTATTTATTTTTTLGGSTSTTNAPATTTQPTSTTTPPTTTTPTIVTLPPPTDPGAGGGGPITNKPPPPMGSSDSTSDGIGDGLEPISWLIRLPDDQPALRYILGIEPDQPAVTTTEPPTNTSQLPSTTTTEALGSVVAATPPAEPPTVATASLMLFETPWNSTLNLGNLSQLIVGAYLWLTTTALGLRVLLKLRTR